MRRSVVTQLTGAGIGAALWAAAMLLPYAEPAQAQSALLAHLHETTIAPTAAAEVRSMVGGDVQREVECLALNVYWEARGEPMPGKIAVAAVTLNRVVHPDFPDSICQVVKQGVRLGYNRCQFSWACDRYGDRPRDANAWELAKEVAFTTLFLDEPDPTAGATYFHATRVRPSWSRAMEKVARIGRHIYYRPPVTAERETPDQRS